MEDIERQLAEFLRGIPLWLLPVIWFVTRFGKPSREDKLKTLCEAG